MPRKKLTQEAELMPFQKNYQTSAGRIYGKSPMPSVLSSIELAKMSLPFFGGEGETGAEGSESEASTTGASGSTGGGDGKAEITPEQFAQITAQVAELTSKNTELTTQLSSFTSKEEETRKASLGREESLTEDLTSAQQTIAQMDQVIKRLAVVNAIALNGDLQFHNPDDVIARLDPKGYTLDVDLEAGKASVKGIENELSRIAKENEYLVKKPVIENNNEPNPRVRRSTGNPPGPQPTSSTKASRRAELEAKWPVIGAGRAKLG